MARWTVEVLAVAERELKALPDDLQAKFIHVAGLLEEFGPQKVREPHVRPLGGKLWEMRLTGRKRIARALYFAARDRRLVVVRIVKKSQKTPRREIALAEQRIKEQVSG